MAQVGIALFAPSISPNLTLFLALAQVSGGIYIVMLDFKYRQFDAQVVVTLHDS